MRGGRFGLLVLAAIAGCHFNGKPQAGPDADPADPDGPPGEIDANLTVPDAMVIPDAPPGTPDARPDLPDAFVPLCPAVYTPGATGSQYRFVSSTATWGQAEADCEDDAGPTDIPTHLAVIDSSSERSALAAVATDQWIGLTDLLTEDTFIFITPQAAVDTSGVTGSNAMKDCVRLTSGGGYAARDCTNTNRYVCECDGFGADHARFPNPP